MTNVTHFDFKRGAPVEPQEAPRDQPLTGDLKADMVSECRAIFGDRAAAELKAKLGA